jgi:hypothetical protein
MGNGFVNLAADRRQCDHVQSPELSRLPVSARDHQSHSMALPQIHAELTCIEDLLAERNVIVSYESIRQWCATFGLDYARRPYGAQTKPRTASIR